MSQKEPTFGTDGVRGLAGAELTPELALKIGRAAAYVLAKHMERPRVFVGRDTRVSGTMLGAAICAGLTSMGCEACAVGVLPTPGISQLAHIFPDSVGVVISASHNPYYDNGIKFFGDDGRKLSDAAEAEIVAAMHDWESLPRLSGGSVGRISQDVDYAPHYIQRVLATVPEGLAGLKLVLDTANGATYSIAPDIFRRLGAEVDVIHDAPNGVNINDRCGSTHPESLRERVKESGADAGLAFDGDGDRVMMCDENGVIVDGDAMMYICALGLQSRGELTGNRVVSTVMSNAGFELALNKAGIELIRADVGDRYVAAEMERTDASLGGEQSGHLLFPHTIPSGDGMVTGLQVLREMRHSGKRLSEIASQIESVPQLLRNVRVRDREGWKNVPEIQDAIADARSKMSHPGWLSVRASGTEPLIRVMAQDTDADRVQGVVSELCSIIEAKFGI